MLSICVLAALAPAAGFAPGVRQATPSFHLHRKPSVAMAAATAAEAAADETVDTSLLTSLRRVSDLRDKVVVVKFGGHAMSSDELSALFASDIALLQSLGLRPVVVHGGGPQINAMLDRLQVESEFVDGLRVTTPAAMEVVEMVLCGSLNKKIASSINAAGGRAVGLSGKDDAIVSATRKLKPDLGLVGEPSSVRVDLLHQLLDAGVVPVLAPVASGEGGASYNVNADTMAGCIAGALSAGTLLLLTDVAGVLDSKMRLMRTLSTSKALSLTEDGTATGGMIPKLKTAIDAVDGGASEAVIMDGRVPHCTLVHLFGEGAVGTAIARE